MVLPSPFTSLFSSTWAKIPWPQMVYSTEQRCICIQKDLPTWKVLIFVMSNFTKILTVLETIPPGPQSLQENISIKSQWRSQRDQSFYPSSSPTLSLCKQRGSFSTWSWAIDSPRDTLMVSKDLSHPRPNLFLCSFGWIEQLIYHVWLPQQTTAPDA